MFRVTLFSLVVVGFSGQLVLGNHCQTLGELFWQLTEKYSAKQFGAGKPVPIGIELEGTVNSYYAREDVAFGIKGELERLDRVNELGIASIRVVSKRGHWGTEYEVKWLRRGREYSLNVSRDPSIRVVSGQAPMEFASPILYGDQDRRIFADLVRYVESAFEFKPNPVNSGMHIHVDFTDHAKAEIALLEIVFSELEADLLATFQTADERRKWAQPVANKRLRRGCSSYGCVDYHPDQVISAMENYLRTASALDQKYTTLNFLPLNRIGTVEFRLFNSTANLEVISMAADFCQKLVGAIRSKDQRLMEYLYEKQQIGEITIDGLASVLNLELNNQFRNLARTIRREIQDERDSYQTLPEVSNNRSFRFMSAGVESPLGELTNLMHFSAIVAGVSQWTELLKQD